MDKQTYSNNVISISSFRNSYVNSTEEADYGSIDGVVYKKPNSKEDYINICKKVLTVEDYEEVLLAILDHKYYEDLESDLAKIVDCYFSFDFW